MNIEDIKDTLLYGERINLECKKAEGKLPNALWETYSAFANTIGGLILLGVEENTKEVDHQKRFSFTSVTNPKLRLKEFWDTINSAKVSSNILVDANVGVCNIEGADIIWIEVPQADYKNKPIYINDNINKGTFKRNHEGDYHCTEDEIKAMLRDASSTGNDGSILIGYTMDDIDMKSLESYRIEFQTNHPDHIWNSNKPEEFLKNMSCYALDRTTGKSWLTTAGLLMFGKGLPIRERFDNIRMDYLDQTNLLPGSRWSDRLTYDGMWENNLYNFMRLVMPKLVSGIKRPFKLEGMVRVDDTPVHKAIRESVVNMLIHSDYLINGVLKIVKRDDGFLFSNPGGLKLSVRAIYDGGHSVARNPRIQNLLRMIGYGDNIGSGFPTILESWKGENWRKPDLSQDEELHCVDLKLWMISLLPQECTEHLSSLLGNTYYQLDKDMQIVLSTAFLEGQVTNARLQSILDMHSTDIGHLLATLVEKNMLVVNRKGRWTSYRINEEYDKGSEQLILPNLDNNGPIIKIESDRLIYEYIKANGFITSKEVPNVTNIKSKSGSLVAINRLISSGVVKRERQGKTFIYVLSNS